MLGMHEFEFDGYGRDGLPWARIRTWPHEGQAWECRCGKRLWLFWHACGYDDRPYWMDENLCSVSMCPACLCTLTVDRGQRVDNELIFEEANDVPELD